MEDLAALAIVAIAIAYFGSGFALHLWRTEVAKAAMRTKFEKVISPPERVWILEKIHDDLKENHVGDPQLWSMSLDELIRQPESEFHFRPGHFSRARLGILRGLYAKIKITEG